MATGYTDKIAKNPNYTFKEFAMQCARAFGPCIMMRDDSHDVEITTKKLVDDSTYNKSMLKAAKDELKQLEAVSWTSDIFQKKITKEREKSKELILGYLEEARTTRKRYETMLEQVNAWTPPTEDHVNFKKFMISQIDESIRFDCHEESYLESLKEFEKPINFLYRYEEEVDCLERQIKRKEEQLSKQKENNDGRVKWVSDLCDSLGLTLKEE